MWAIYPISSYTLRQTRSYGGIETDVSELKSLITLELPTGNTVSVVRRRFGHPGGLRVSIVAGIRGDAPEGIRVAHQLGAFLEEREDSLRGCVDIYPCMNPLASEQGSRRWPFFGVDLNRLFPGRPDGHPPDRTAFALSEDIRGTDQAIELRGARPSFFEATQAHVRVGDAKALDLAMHANVRVVWERSSGPAAPSTFAHQIPDTIVLEGGSGNRLTQEVGRDLLYGLISLLVSLEVLPEDELPFHWATLTRPERVGDEQVVRVRSNQSGLFLPAGAMWGEVSSGELLGEVIDPTTGKRLSRIVSPVSGRLLAVREHPAVYEGTMVARVVVL